MNRTFFNSHKKTILICFLLIFINSVGYGASRCYEIVDSVSVDDGFLSLIESAISTELEGLKPCLDDDISVYVSIKTKKRISYAHIEGYTSKSILGKYYCKHNNVLYSFDSDILFPLFRHTGKTLSFSIDETIGEPEIVSNLCFDNYGKELYLKSNDSEDAIYNVVESMPSPKEGWEALNYIIREKGINISKKDTSREGNIVISFVVEIDGRLSNFQIIKSECNQANEKAMSLLQNTSPWMPGKVCCLPRRVRMTLSVKCKY